MSLQERISYLELNSPSYIRKRRMQIFHMMMRSLVQGLEYSIIYSSAWPYLSSMEVDTWFYGLVVAISPVGTIVLLPVVGWLYDKTKDAKRLHTLLNLFGIVGSFIYSMPFTPWLPLIGRLLGGARIADIPISQGEVAWTYKTQDRLRAFSYVLVGFLIGVVVSPLFSLTFEHINIHTGDLYIDYRNLPGIALAIMCVILEISNQLMMFNLAKTFVEADGEKSGKDGLKNSLGNVVSDNQLTGSPHHPNADKLSVQNVFVVQMSSSENVHWKAKESNQEHSTNGDVIETGIPKQILPVELAAEAVQRDSNIYTIKNDKSNLDSIVDKSVMEQTHDIDSTYEKYGTDGLRCELNKCIEDANVLSNAYATKVDSALKEPQLESDLKSIDVSVEGFHRKHVLNSSLNAPLKRKSKVIAFLREVCCFEIIGVAYCSVMMWVFLTEGITVIPVVTQDHFGWSVLESNVIYLIGAVMTILMYIIIMCIGNRISDACYLLIILPIASTAPIFLMLYSKAEEDTIGAKVLFFAAVFLGVLTEPFANAVVRSLLSKITPIEFQGSIGSFVTLIIKGGNLLGPLYATLVLEYMVTCNLISTFLMAIGFFWLLLSLRKLNYRRTLYDVNTNA